MALGNAFDSFNGRGENDMVYGCNNKLKIQWYPLIYNYKRWTYITRIILKKLSNFVQLDPFVFFGVNVTILDYIWSVCCCDCDKHHFNLHYSIQRMYFKLQCEINVHD
ncbi:hypothetical protein DERP_005895 [Dermatophagoides pteronyssinus]|uniref:Uncharacterized protein n=1 Tax=Dermatophagoides pteronyssinus TaxID=6956 RepID=A0ABQ8J9Z1_DERPT|nr:hypothetical protein DERP_015055 [Dermatophagoides pteronyssinus]KAH9419383.1 hypothetical protein DERP_005895 [Dermatophagoides pteronyssinus]